MNTNITSPYETKLINFNVPMYLIDDLDDLVKFKNSSRTSILNRLIEDYLRVEFDLLSTDNRFKRLLSNVRLRNKSKPTFFKEYLKEKPVHLSNDTEPTEIPDIPLTQDIDQTDHNVNDDFWNSRLNF